MIDREHELPVARQAAELGISRSSVYCLPRPTSPQDLKLMRRIDELHLDYPFAGSRMLQKLLKREGYETGRLHVRTLMKRMGIEALYRKPRTSKPGDGHKIYPYLLGKLAVTRPNQVWATDLTYIPMARGFCYLVAVVDWFTQGSGMAAVDHHGCGLLHRSRRGGAGEIRQARNLQLRPRQPVHQP
jgi:putative transposase